MVLTENDFHRSTASDRSHVDIAPPRDLRKGQRRRGKLRLRDFRDAGPAHPRDRARRFPPNWALIPPFPGKQSSRNLSARRSPQLFPVTTQGGVGSRCRPSAPSCVLQPPRSTSRERRPHIVLSRTAQQRRFGLPERLLSHCQSARSELFAVCSTEHPFQIQNLSIFHATRRTGPAVKLPPRQPSPLASVSPLALQLYHCSIGFPHAWRTFFLQS